jgi:hypothetical protein
VTGWQSGGDQGGWNPNQSFGPEAQTNRYDDPYNYGSDPYPGLQDPYPQYGTGPYGGGGYDQQQQQYPPTGGFPAPGYGPPPPPPKRSKLPMILSLVAILIIVGAVVAIVLVNRTDSSGQPTAQEKSSSTNTSKQDPSSEKPTSPSSGGGSDHGDWISIDNVGLSYQVPADWQRADGSVESGLEVKFGGVANFGIYDCEDKNYVRTFAASGSVQGKDEKDLDLATTVEDFAKSFAAQGYSADSEVNVPTPTEVKIGDRTGMTVTAKVKVKVTVPNCQATDAEVAIVGVPVEEEGKPKGVAMLVVVSDVAGGPSETKSLDPSVTQEILKTVKVS